MNEKLNQNHSINESKLEMKDFESVVWELTNILEDFRTKDNEIEDNELIIFSLSDQFDNRKIINVSWKFPNITFETYNEEIKKKEFIIYNVKTSELVEDIDKNEILKNLEKWQVLLSAMEEIFTQNNKELFWELNDEDTLKTDIFDKHEMKLKWKNLREIQVLLSENIQNLSKVQSIFTDKQKKDFLRQQKKYLEFIMWIWDKYEWAASYLKETTWNFESITKNIVSNSPIDEVFVYMAEMHQKIDDNNKQSKSVEDSYKDFMDFMSMLLLARLKSDPETPERYFVNFSKLLTWRWEYKNGDFSSADIDDDLRNPKLATEALMYVFMREWWMLEKMGLKNLDKNLANKRVGDELEEFYDCLKTTWSPIPWEQLVDPELLSLKDKKYEELDLEAQSKLSFINRLKTELNNRRLSWKKVDYSNDLNNKDNIQFIVNDIQNKCVLDIQNSLEKNISSNYFFDKSFWVWKSAEDFWLKWVQKEAYDLFVNMNWVWLLTISDNSAAVLKEGWKILGMLGVWFAAHCFLAPLALWVIAHWAVMWAGLTVVAEWISSKWYDSKKEMATDLSSSLILWTTLWGVWSKIIDLWKNIAPNAWRLVRYTKNWVILWADLWTWFLLEGKREKIINHKFHSQQKLIEVPPEVSLKDIYANPEKYKNPE